MDQDEAVTEPPTPPIISPDGLHVWDGQRWQLRTQVISPDGREIWDGERWRPRGPGGDRASNETEQANAEGESEQVDDSWVERSEPLLDDPDRDPWEASDLQLHIRRRTRRGYRVVSQTSHAAQLVKPKRFSASVFIILLLLCLFPAIVYLAVYSAKQDRTVDLEITNDGSLLVNGRIVDSDEVEHFRFPSWAKVAIVLLVIYAAYSALLSLSGGGGERLVATAIVLGIAVAIWQLNTPD